MPEPQLLLRLLRDRRCACAADLSYRPACPDSAGAISVVQDGRADAVHRRCWDSCLVATVKEVACGCMLSVLRGLWAGRTAFAVVALAVCFWGR